MDNVHKFSYSPLQHIVINIEKSPRYFLLLAPAMTFFFVLPVTALIADQSNQPEHVFIQDVGKYPDKDTASTTGRIAILFFKCIFSLS